MPPKTYQSVSAAVVARSTEGIATVAYACERAQSYSPASRCLSARVVVASSYSDLIESALEYERGKKDRFDELFKKATEKHKDEPKE